MNSKLFFVITIFFLSFSQAIAMDQARLACCENYMSPAQVTQAKLDVLDGSVEAADKLCLYVVSTPNSYETYIGWLQVGAENGSTKCMFQIFQVLSHQSAKMEDHRRARYWARRLVEAKFPDAVLYTKGCEDLDSKCYATKADLASGIAK
ncbi:MAG: hypothetical protein JSR34_03210 [Proteobacteria bacterium]|nr:hypothetical protein [Pseudomonadota bacterium]